MNRKNILIIEDNISTLASYIGILESMELEIVIMVAPDYERSKKFIASERVDLILLDNFLPDAMATDILPEIRAFCPDVPIFIITGDLEALDFDQVARFHITHVFPKPLYVETFSRAVQAFL